MKLELEARGCGDPEVLALYTDFIREADGPLGIDLEAVPELETGPVAAELELRTVLVAERELEVVQAEEPVPNQPHGHLAVPEKTKSVTALHPHGLVPLLVAVVDLVAVAQTMREQAAAEAVIAWEVADIVAVAAVVVVVAEDFMVAEVAVAVVTVAEDAAEAEDAEDKGRVNDEETNENKNKYYDFAENFSGRFCGPYFLFVNDRSARCAIGQNRCACDIAASPKTIRHTKAGSRRPCSGRGEF